jgi:hypothetical protein
VGRCSLSNADVRGSRLEQMGDHFVSLRGGADGPAGLLLAIAPAHITHISSCFDKRERVNMLRLHLANGRVIGVYEPHANDVLEVLGLGELTNDWVLNLEKDIG